MLTYKNFPIQKRYIFCLTFCLTASHIAWSQSSEKIVISGYIQDASDGESLIGATVFIKSLLIGGTSNEYGFYSITLPKGSYRIQVSYIGYKPYIDTLVVDNSLQKNISLQPMSEELQEVIVEGKARQSDADNTEMNINTMNIKTMMKMPSFMGEVDVLKSILLLPGVSTVGEGASGFNVRGGTVGQNLILLDEAPVYNSSHLLGFFSSFNPDAIKNIKLYKGAPPARYGGRIVSVLDVRMKEGNQKQYALSGGVGLIFSRLAVEGPIAKDKASFIVAARRSYLDVLANTFISDFRDSGLELYFYDINAKINYTINKNNKLYLSGYFGRDTFMFSRGNGFNWGNATATLRWNHLYGKRLFSNVTFVYSNYDYKLQFGSSESNQFRWNSDVANFVLKPEFSYFLNEKNELSFGLEAIYYNFNPANAAGVSNGQTTDISLDRKYTLEVSAFASNKMKVTSFLSLEYGLRVSHFQSFGPGKIYQYGASLAGQRKTPLRFDEYGAGESISSYTNLEPRFSFSFKLGQRSSIKGSYARMAQYIHLISNTTASNPLDVWVPSSRNTKPETSHQGALGYFRDIGRNNMFEASAEVYFRYAENQIDYINGADLLINPLLEGDLLNGKGRAYGLELYFRKTTGKFTGWISYTLGRTELKVPGINNDTWYPTRYDQTNNLKLALFYEFNQRWSISANFAYTSGTPSTFPTSSYYIQDELVLHNTYESRNNVRIPDYHRLDLGVRYDGKKVRKKDGKKKKLVSYWTLSLYNVYARRNPFSISFSQDGERERATQLSIIPTIVPSISWNFRFVPKK